MQHSTFREKRLQAKKARAKESAFHSRFMALLAIMTGLAAHLIIVTGAYL